MQQIYMIHENNAWTAPLCKELDSLAGIEFIIDRHGELVTYDVNTNTNYNPGAEAAAGIFGMKAVAHYLGTALSYLKDESAEFNTLGGQNTGQAMVT